MRERLRTAAEHLYMLAVCFFLLWNLLYMTEARWTFPVLEAIPAVSVGLAAASLLLCRRPVKAGLLLALPLWMVVASAYRGAAVLQMQLPQIARAALALGVMLPAPLIVRRERLMRYVRAVLALWTGAMTLQALIGLWAALTGHAVFSLQGTWYIGVNLGDHRLYLNAYVTTGATKMGLSVLLAVLAAAMTRRRPLKLLYGLCAAVQLCCLSLTDCRTAFIAVGASLGVMAAAAFLHGGGPRRALALAAVPLGVLAAYVCLSGLLTLLAPHVPQTLENLTLTELPAQLLPQAAAEGAVQHRTLDAGNLFNDRQIIWQAALRLLGEEPRFLLTGTTTALSPVLTNAMIPPDMYPGRDFVHVHSLYLQTLVSWGIPGLALLGALLWRFLRAAWRVMAVHEGLPLWQRLVPAPVMYVLLCETVDCFTRLAEESPLLLFACLMAGLTLRLDAEAQRSGYEAAPAAEPVDVIIPVYNAAAYVRRAAESALACPGARVILVDDGSTDGSGEICDGLAAQGCVTVLHQENRGASAARNTGLAAATAELVAFLDADDVLLPGALAALTAQLGPAEAIQGRVVRQAPEDLSAAACRRLSGREALAEALGDPTRHLLCHGWVFRRSLLTERFDERLTLGEDGEWLLRTLRHAETVAFADTAAYCYTVRPDSALRSGTDAEVMYLRTLAAAAPALDAIDLPQAAALYRLTHLLLMLTHDHSADMAALRESAPFAQAFACARLRGFSPRMVTLRLLRQRWYPAARLAISLRRAMNRRAGRRAA